MGKKFLIGLIASSILLLIIGLSLLFTYPVFYNKEASLTKNSAVYDKWVKPDYPVLMKYHFFTYTNADRFISGQDKRPEVVEAGILSYREYQEKFDIRYEDWSKKVTYYNNKWYVFDNETSTLNENDTVVIPNILLFTVLNSAPKALEKQILEVLINKWAQDGTLKNDMWPFYEVEVGNFLWGYEENLLLTQLNHIMGGPTKFGMQMNYTDDGLYEVYTGKGRANHNRGIVTQWNKTSSLNYWNGNTCNMINGTDGTIFPTDVESVDRLYIFNTQVCRSIFLISDHPEDIEGVDTTRYIAPAEVFQVDFEDNICFCEGSDIDKCLGDGLLDVSTCYEEMIAEKVGQPLTMSVILSSPEFLYASNETIHSIDGFDPKPEKHETYLNLNRETGVILAGAKRIQMNTQLRKFKLDSLENLDNDWSYIVPLFWGEEVLDVDDSLVDLVKESQRVSLAVTIISIACISIGIILLIAAILSLVFYERTDKGEYQIQSAGEREPLLKH